MFCLIASGAPLQQTLETLLRLTEAEISGLLSSIFLLEDNKRLRHVASPSIPAAFSAAIDGVAIGPVACSFGTAAFTRKPAIVRDIATDPLWVNYKDIALKHGLRACWSYPIFDSKQNVLGTFTLYYRTPKSLDRQHLKLIESVTHLAAIAIAKHREEQMLHSNEHPYRSRGGHIHRA